MRRFLFALLCLLPVLAQADATVPNKDVDGARDLPFLKRYEGSFIVNYEQKAFDQLVIPLSTLQPVPDKTDRMNNRVLEPQKKVVAEGRYTRLLYVVPDGRSPLEVVRNYVDEIRAAGGTALYSCKNTDCGGDLQGNDHGGGTQGLLEKLYPQERVKAQNFTNGNCASTMDISEQRYVAFKVPTANGDAHVALLVYSVEDDLYCKALNNYTVAMVVVIEPKAREQRMVTVSAAEMAQSLNASGRIALYGIFFDTNKTDIKPESTPALEQIAALLKSDPALKVYIVGHTDNVGNQAANLDLSKRRANAVVAALVGQYGARGAQMEAAGVGMLSPVASNDDDAGRGKNRRVELVKK
ncbi:OmpA family protein [Arenimonas oryziterrae]|uniref:OmpA-like domain-containing protein n=1 Tax=Arenimonas oryziterrae DSM 21050 = YC6267 TaxID=1121015 RepID=A0A091AXY6_9GAMM|nr:OmpA family protein [Arenimonas oryziterrae]KFN43484.1 hypothetical protein N789_09420 [Arenimonas oryziterrae DSM 21050 = YC6267]